MDKVKEIVKKYLGRKVDACKFFFNIISVDCKLKPAYLYDLSTPYGSKLVDVLHELQQHELINNCLNVVQIDLDCLIVNVDLIKMLNFDGIDNRLIDVSQKACKPRLLQDGAAVNGLKACFSEICENIDCTIIKCFVLHSTAICNISSLFGFMLNYPLIYWYDVNDAEGGNCLAMEPLMVVTITMSLEKSGNARALQAAVSQLHSKQSLYQFSYPRGLKHCEDEVSRWWYQLKSDFRKSAKVDEFQIGKECVTLDAVAL